MDAEMQRLDAVAVRARDAVILRAQELIDSAVLDFERDRFIVPKDRFAGLLGALTRYQSSCDDVMKRINERIDEIREQP